MKWKIPIWFLAALAVYGLQLAGKFGLLELPYIFIAYAADLMCLPILVFLCEKLMAMILRKEAWTITFPMLFAIVAYVSLVFEVLLPLASPRYVADPMDVLCYGIGGSLYLYLKR
jgi:hypothetical protein